MINVAILGAGIGREHLAGYRALPDRYTVRRVIDRDTDRAREILDGDTCPAVSAEISDAMTDPQIDLVDICLPPQLHFPVAMDAIAAGKHVVCEKPMVTSLRDADMLVRAAEDAAVVVSPVFQYRYGQATAELDALIAAGLTGRPHMAAAETHWRRDAAYYAVPWRGTWAGEQGGAVLGHAIHSHDLLTHYFGPVAAVSAELSTRINTIETEDCAAILMRFKSGAMATSNVTLGAARDETRLRFVFEHLTATSGTSPYRPAEDNWSFTARDPDRQPEIDAVRQGVAPVRSGFAGYLDALADAMAGRRGREVTLADGRRSIDLVSAIYAAARRGKPVSLPLPGDDAVYQGWQPEGAETKL